MNPAYQYNVAAGDEWLKDQLPDIFVGLPRLTNNDRFAYPMIEFWLV